MEFWRNFQLCILICIYLWMLLSINSSILKNYFPYTTKHTTLFQKIFRQWMIQIIITNLGALWIWSQMKEVILSWFIHVLEAIFKMGKVKQWKNGGEEDKFLQKLIKQGKVHVNTKPAFLQSEYPAVFGSFSPSCFCEFNRVVLVFSFPISGFYLVNAGQLWGMTGLKYYSHCLLAIKKTTQR